MFRNPRSQRPVKAPVLRPTRIAAALAAAAAALALPARGQSNDGPVTPPPTTQQLQGVTVTGSNIKRIDTTTDTPVQVLKREDIVRSGARTVRELIDTLASSTANSSLSDIDGSNSFSPGASGASLRNLGKQSTLVLLNFRRVAPYALADYNEVFANLDALPFDVVERVEILKNGAAAIYGSDAVAGVINIITRSDYRGLQVSASHEQSITSGELGNTRASITGGFGDLNTDRYNVIFNVEGYHRDPLIWGDVLGYVRPEYATIGGPFGYGTGSSYSYPGNVQQKDGSLAPAAGCDPSLVVGGLCRFDRYSRFEAVNKSDRLQAFTGGTFKFNDTLTAFAEGNYSHIRTKYRSPYAIYGRDQAPVVWGDPRTLQPKTFTYYGLPKGNAYNPSGEDNANFRYRFVDGDSEEKVDSDQYRALAGLRGNAYGWDWETAIGWLGSRTDDKQRGGISDSGFKQEVGDYTQLNAAGYPSDPNFFNHGYKLGQKNSDEVLNTLFPTYGYKGRYDQGFIDAKASGEVYMLPAGAVQMAVGAEFRHEKFKIEPSEALATGDIVGYGTSATSADRNFGAIYGELRIPIVKTLEASLAVRYDKYPHFPGRFSPKAGLRWQPAEELLVRGTYETGFRAPNLTESAPSTKFAFIPGVSDPKRCPQASKLSADLQAQANALPDSDPNKASLSARAENVLTNECSTSLANVVTDNPDLGPEKSRSYSLGIVVVPARGISGSIDYWNIYRRDEIGTLSINQLLAEENNLPAGNVISRYSPNVADPTFTPAELAQYGVTTTALLSSQQQFINTAKTKTSGVDLGLTAEAPLPDGWGRLRLTGDATYLFAYKAFSEALGAYGDNLAGRYGYPRLKMILTGSWNYGPFETTLRANFLSGTTLKRDYDDVTYKKSGCLANFGFDGSQCHVSSYTTWDALFQYTGVTNLTLYAGMKNIFGTKPPIDRRAFIDSGGFIIPIALGDVAGRLLRVGVDYKFY